MNNPILKYKNDEIQLLKKFPPGANGNKFIRSPIEIINNPFIS